MEKSLKNAFDNSAETEEKTTTPIELAVPIKLIGTEEEKQHLARIVNRTAKSKLGKSTLESAAKAGFVLDFISMPGIAGACNTKDKIISLGQAHSDDNNVITLAHESRHVDQFLHNKLNSLGHENIKSQIILDRAMEADAERAACVVSWELKELGDESAYKHFSSGYSYITKPFEEALEKGENANLAAFKSWYDSEIRKTSYEKLYIVDQLEFTQENDESGKLEFNENFSCKEIVDSVCFTENGGNYFTDAPEVLEEKKFLGVKQKTMDFLKEFMKDREEKYGLAPDKSIDELPIRSFKGYSQTRKQQKAMERLIVLRSSAMQSRR